MWGEFFAGWMHHLYPKTAWIACCVLLLQSALALANRVDIPLTVRESQLFGIGAEARYLINIDSKKDRRSDPVLVFSWRKSQLVDPRLSTLSVGIDGRVLRSMWAPEADEGEFTIPLRGIEGGPHQITVRSSMRVRDDPCLQRYREDAWFAVRPTSRVSWDRVVAVATQISVSEIPGSWSRLAEGQSGIVLEFIAPLDPAGVGAYLDADHLLRRWGYAPESIRSARTVGKMRLALFDPDTPTNPAIAKLKALPGARFAAAIDTAGTLHVAGRDTESLREALLAIGDDFGRRLCDAASCGGGAQILRPLTTTPGNTPPANQVWQLGATGSPNGWLAQGEGRHVLRFAWPRPPSLTPKEWPVLLLYADASSASGLDQKLSSITVRINDQPIATYSLEQWRSSKAEVRVPRHFWSEGEWLVEIGANLKSTDAKACERADPDAAWLRVLPETAIIVPREDLIREGIARHHAAVMKSGAPLLQIENPTLPQLSLVAPVVYPFMKERSTQATQEWRWEIAEPSACDTRSCVLVKDQAPDDSPLKIQGSSWVDASGLLRVPYVDTRDSVALFHRAGRDDRPAHLVMVAGPRSVKAPAIEPPDYKGFVGRIALYAQQWHVLDVGPAVRGGADESAAKPSEPAVVSKEQKNLRLMNFVWAALSVLLITALVVKLWRNPRSKKPSSDWEIDS